MHFLEALFLGFVQGVTEFLPISSSGHLVLFQRFLGYENLDSFLFFDLVCHMGTLLAICVYFYKPILIIFKHSPKQILKVFLGTAMLVPLLFFLKPIEHLFDRKDLLGFFFATTAALLFAGEKLKPKNPLKAREDMPYLHCIVIGLFQALAIVPGISRTGATVSSARALGWSDEKALLYSFLLAIPAICGGFFIKVIETYSTPVTASDPFLPLSILSIGFISSAFFGYLALTLLVKMAAKNQFSYFIYYCAGLSILCFFIF